MTHSTNNHKEESKEKPLSAKKLKERIDRAMLTTTIASTFVAVIAAAVLTAYEAHQARVVDERPFLAVDISPSEYDLQLPQSSRTLNLVAHLVALGKSPPRNIQSNCLGFEDSLFAKFTWPPKGLPKPQVTTFPFIFPGRSANADCPNYTNPSRTSGNTVTYRIGYVTYEDDHMVSYVTPFSVLAIPRATAPTYIVPCNDGHRLPKLK